MDIYFSCFTEVLSASHNSSVSCLSLNKLNLADEMNFSFSVLRLNGVVQDSSGEESQRIEIAITKAFVSGWIVGLTRSLSCSLCSL